MKKGRSHRPRRGALQTAVEERLMESEEPTAPDGGSGMTMTTVPLRRAPRKEKFAGSAYRCEVAKVKAKLEFEQTLRSTGKKPRRTQGLHRESLGARSHQTAKAKELLGRPSQFMNRETFISHS
jgi:hypothetical protein